MAEENPQAPGSPVPMTPTQWFDQFVDAPRHPQMDDHGQWCWRHWAPCPTLHANGIQAFLMVMDRFVNRVLVPAGIRATDVKQANAKLRELGRLCCWLGDQEMYDIWGQCGPTKEEN